MRLPFYRIVHNDPMANGVNSGIHANVLINGRLKLPPIATGYSNDKHDNNYMSSYRNVNLSRQNMTFPRVHSGSQHSTFVPFERVYTVLPPIGKAFVPSAPQAKIAIPSAPGNGIEPKRSIRRPRIKKQQSTTQAKIVSNDDAANGNVSKSVVDNASLIRKSTASLGESENVDSKSIEIDFAPKKDSRKITSPHSDALKSESSGDDTNRGSLASNVILTSLGEAPAKRDIGFHHKNDVDIESLFPQLSNIPEDMRLYEDVYPSSPPPHDRKAKIVVEKARQLLQEDNGYRILFMEDVGHRRRNATCAELDDVLKNAVQLLKDVFLKRTMEELCMLW